MVTSMAAGDKPKEKPLSPMSLATWARLGSAGKGPNAGKPNGAEKWDENPDNPKKTKPKKAK